MKERKRRVPGEHTTVREKEGMRKWPTAVQVGGGGGESLKACGTKVGERRESIRRKK